MKNKDLISKMTTAQKAALLSGKDAWETRAIRNLNIPALACSDGPHGVRKQAGAGDHLGINAALPATCFPTAATIANSWDETLGEEIGKALGEEALVLDVQVLLGPGLNIKRSPLCGRNFEYFSEDPYLAGKMTASYAKGIQSKGVYSCIKHFAANSQEMRRMAMNSVLDERTLREIYLTGFEIGIKEGGAKAIMTSYNQVNGVYANENRHLLKDILRGEWEFDGIVITDWGGSNDHVEGVKQGSNLEMPNPGLDSARQILRALKENVLTKRELDECVDPLLTAILKTNAAKAARPASFDSEAHHALAKRAAVESGVLLKNENAILPLRQGVKVAIIGDFAFEPRYQGAGSSLVNATRTERVCDIAANYKEWEIIGAERGFDRLGAADAKKEADALRLAKEADVVLYFFGLDEMSESEGLDRSHMRLPKNQIRLLEEMAKVNSNIVGILSAGSAVETGWRKHCKAILHGYLNGQAGAGAVCELLLGKECPSGKLAESYPIRYEDTPAFSYYPAKQRNSEYREGIFVGYRYYDTAGVEVAYPFGFGLSYTEFSYGNLEIDKHGVSFDITNVGERAGAEIAQMYIGLENSEIYRAKKELKGFAKVYLEPGETKKVRIAFDDKSFRFWDVDTNRWQTEAGRYQISIGKNVQDIVLQGELSVDGIVIPKKDGENVLSSYFSGKIANVSDAEYKAMLGHPIPDGAWSGEFGINDAICQMYYAKSRLARWVLKYMERVKKKSEEKGKPDLNILFVYNMPIRAIAKMSNGMVSMEMVQGMADVINGRFFKGMGRVIRGYFHNRRANREYEKRMQNHMEGL